jgi:uncharacterized protein HemY
LLCLVAVVVVVFFSLIDQRVYAINKNANRPWKEQKKTESIDLQMNETLYKLNNVQYLFLLLLLM